MKENVNLQNRTIVVLLTMLILGVSGLSIQHLTDRPAEAQTSRRSLPTAGATKGTFKKLGGFWINLNYIESVSFQDKSAIVTISGAQRIQIPVTNQSEIAWLKRYLQDNEAK